MSHFITVVRLPGTIKQRDLEDELYKRMIPYYELGTSEARDKDVKPYLEWEDHMDECRKGWEEDTTSYVRLPDGTECSAYEEKFRNPKWDAKNDERYLYPLGTEKFDKLVKETYQTFQEYCEDYHGYKKNEYGSYGRWHNPNDKWDWYSIGGRWTGYFPTKATARSYAQSGQPGLMTKVNTDKAKADIVRISDLDMDRIERETEVAKIDFWNEWLQFVDGKEWQIFDGPRDQALSLGLVVCKSMDELTDEDRGPGFKIVPWKDRNRCDVLRLIEREDLEQFTGAFCKVAGYARLDDEHKWQAPGDMGWFGCSSDTPDLYKDYKNSALAWYQQGDQSDWVIAVDCHI